MGVRSSIIKAQQKHRNPKPRKEGKSYVKQILSSWQNDCRSRNQDQQKQIDKIIGIRSELIEALKKQFSNSEFSITVDPQTGAITFDSKLLFDFDKYELKDEGVLFLKSFLPKYMNILLSKTFSQYLAEIIIEGHTDNNGSYMYNLALSQNRALAVSSYCLDDKNIG